MKGTIQSLSLNMLDGTKTDSSVRAKQFDTNSRQLKIWLMANSKRWQIPEDCKIYLYVKKPDGKVVFNECEQEGENVVTAPLTEQTLAAAGNAQCELYIHAADGDIKSQTFRLIIEKAIMDADAIESSDEFGALAVKLVELQEAVVVAKRVTEELQELIDAGVQGIQGEIPEFEVRDGCLYVIYKD